MYIAYHLIILIDYIVMKFKTRKANSRHGRLSTHRHMYVYLILIAVVVVALVVEVVKDVDDKGNTVFLLYASLVDMNKIRRVRTTSMAKESTTILVKSKSLFQKRK